MPVDSSGLYRQIAALERTLPVYLEDLAEELQHVFHALVEENFQQGGGGGPFNSSSRLRVQSGDLTRSFIPGQPGNATKITTRDGVLRMSIGTSLPYAPIHEYGGFIKSRGKMEGFMMARYMETRDEAWLAMSLSVRAKGGVMIKPRPFMGPASRKFESYAPGFIERSLVQFLAKTFAPNA